MKRLVFTLTLAVLTIVSFAQTRSFEDLKKIGVPMTMQQRAAFSGNETHPNLSASPANTGSRLTGNSVGQTTYDLQTNNAICRRIATYPNGGVGMTWTGSMAYNITANDRGTGYNYYNGTTWQHSAPFTHQRIENQRTGWPNLIATPSGREMVFTHTGASGVNMAWRTIGSGSTWNNYILPNDPNAVWPRVCHSNDSIYLIVSRQRAEGHSWNDLPGGLAFWRSFDGGDNWIGPDSIPGLNSNNFPFVSGDAYAIDANGSTVAFVVGVFQITLFKSTDAGNTWTHQVIVPASDPLYSGQFGETLDSMVTSDDSYELIVDDNGMVHIWYGRNVVQDDDPNTEGWTYYPYDNAIMYWNETMGNNAPTRIPQTQIANFDPTICFPGFYPDADVRGYFPNITSMPQAGTDAAGNIYLVYSSILGSSLDPNSGNMFRNVYVVKSMDGGNSWIGPLNINNPVNDITHLEEAVYPSITRFVTDSVRMIYQSDPYPGIAVQSTQSIGYVDNNLIYRAIHPNDIVAPIDLTCPDLFLNGVNTITTYSNCPFDWGAITAYDIPTGDITHLIQTIPPVNTNTVGTYNVGIFALDAAGNSSDTFNLTINVIADVVPPVITLVGPASVDLLVGATYVEPGYDVTDNACPVTNVTVADNINNMVVGTYQVTYDAVDNSGNAAQQVIRTVNVIAADVTAPVITLLGQNPITIEACTGVFVDPGATAFDNIDYDVTVNITVSNNININVPGSYTVTYSVTDNAGNTATLTRTVIVVDTTPPTLTRTGNATILSYLGDAYTDAGATADDCVDGNLDAAITTNISASNPNINQRGSYIVEYNVSDAAGNAATPVQRTVNVNTEPEADFDYVINGLSVQFTDQSLYSPTNWLWNFGDGGSNTSQNPIRTYTTGGTKTVCLQVTNQFNTAFNKPADETCKEIVLSSVADLSDVVRNVSIFPNPTSGVVQVKIETFRNVDLAVSLVNVLGETVIKEKAIRTATDNMLVLDLSQMADGVYFIRIRGEEGTTTRRLMLNKN